MQSIHLPRLLKRIPTAVAVVRSAGGNQAEETAEGTEKTTTPATPFRMAHRWLMLQSTRDKLMHQRNSQFGHKSALYASPHPHVHVYFDCLSSITRKCIRNLPRVIVYLRIRVFPGLVRRGVGFPLVFPNCMKSICDKHLEFPLAPPPFGLNGIHCAPGFSYEGPPIVDTFQIREHFK